jgi:hypothetical protein
MADIVIRGVEMPETNFSYINLQIWGFGGVYKLDKQCNLTPVKYQVVPLPEGHGDLKDSAEIIGKIKEKYCGACLCPSTSFNCQLCKITKVIEIIENVQTIIPAEGGGEDENR